MRTRPALALVVAAVLPATTWGCAVAGSSGSSDGPAPAPSSPVATTPPAATGSVAPARRSGAVVPEPPTTLTLPSGRRVRISPAGTTGAGVLAVPDDVDVAGWWRGGSRLGDPFGSVLVAAHVDSRTQGLGPFAELLTAVPGARLRLSSAGLQQAFEVRSRRLVPQGSLADEPWIFAATGRVRLTLVTCAPPYDAARGGYQNLAVVTAVPVGRPEAT